MTWRGIAFLCAITAILGFEGGRRFTTPKTEQVEVVKETKDIITVVKEITRPDGTKETVTEIKDKSKVNSNSTTTIKADQRLWKATAMVGAGTDLKPFYGGAIERKVLPNIGVGVWGMTNSTAGISVSIEF